MKTIILGKEGNQSFPISDDFLGVSRKHAQITIDDYGDWYLEDLDSTNGTYVRDEENGARIEVKGRRMITPMTFVFLGPDNSMGCCFFAKQAESYGNFMEEHEYMEMKEREFDIRQEKVENAIKYLNLIRFALPMVVIAICASFGGKDVKSLAIRGALTILVIILMLLYDPTKKKKIMQKMREKFSYCPNPVCSNKMTSKEIHNYRCSKCKK